MVSVGVWIISGGVWHMSGGVKMPYDAMSRNAHMKLDEIKKLNHPILDLNDVFCVQGD